MAIIKVVIKNPFNKKINKDFYRYYMLRNSFFMYLFSLMGLLCLFMLVSGMVDAEEGSFQYILMWSIALLGVLFVPIYTFINISMASKRDYNKKKDTIEIFEITKEKIQRSIQNVNTKSAVNWMYINKVVEVKDAFYFFTASDEAFTVAKEGIIEGSVETLRQLIITYMAKDNKGRLKFKSKAYKEMLKQEKQAKKGKKK